MPRKRKATFTRIKRGRCGDGKGGCGYGRGGWLGRVVDLEVKRNATDDSASQSTSEHTSEVIACVLIRYAFLTLILPSQTLTYNISMHLKFSFPKSYLVGSVINKGFWEVSAILEFFAIQVPKGS